MTDAPTATMAALNCGGGATGAAAALLALLSLLSLAALGKAAAGVGPWGLGVPSAHHRAPASKSAAWRGAFSLGGKRDTLQRYVRGVWDRPGGGCWE